MLSSGFGSGGKRLYRLGLGTASFAGVNMVGADNYSPPTPCQVEELLSEFRGLAVGAGGMAMVDSSAQYGNSESLLGGYLRSHSEKRKDFYVATKWGLQYHPTDFCRFDYSRGHLKSSLANSVELLGEIDLFYVHTNPGVSLTTFRQLLEEKCGSIQFMYDLKRQHRYGIQQLGISCSTMQLLLFLRENLQLAREFDVLQINANMMLRRPDVVSELRDFGFNIVLNSPCRKGDTFLRRKPQGIRQIYARITRACPEATVLTGTSSVEHLRMNAEYVDSGETASAVKLRYMSDGCAEQQMRIDKALQKILTAREIAPNRARRRVTLPSKPRHIVDVLVGSWQGRLGPKPVGKERADLERRVARFMGYQRPIEAVVTWGPRKFFARGNDNCVDLAEVLALQRLIDIDASVRECYSPGMSYTIFYEDFEGQYIEQQPFSVFAHYGSELEKLVEVIDALGILKMVRTSDWLIETGKQDEIVAQLEQNYIAIKDYWQESQERGLEGSENYASYKKMAGLGFTHPITQSVRDYYLDRLHRLLRQSRSAADKQDMIIRLFACVLLHRQYAMFRMGSDLEPIKLSFLRVNGGPETIRYGRLDIRTVPAKITKRNLAPWSARGYIREKAGKLLPALRTWSEPVPEGSRWSGGRLELARDGISAIVRADFLESKVNLFESNQAPVQHVF